MTDKIVLSRSSGTFVPALPYGQGADKILLDDVGCIGSESRFADCSHRGWGVHNCGHHEDVSITCGSSKRHNDYRTTVTVTHETILDSKPENIERIRTTNIYK